MLEKFFLLLLISTVFNFNFLSTPRLEIQSDFPKKTGESFGVKINAKSAVVIDAKTKKILFEKEAHKKLPPASLTKIMTVLVALDSNIKLDEPTKISEKSQKMIERTVGLKKDEVVKVKDLIAGSLIASGNDTAQALAETVSGNDISKFINKMNEKVAKLNLVNTHFENPTGLDNENQFSSAYDLAIIFSEAMKNLTFRELIAKKNYEITAITPEKTHKFETSNHLLRDNYPRVFGGKTGYTDSAGYCLINLAKDKNNNQIITVVLGNSQSKQHFQDTKALIDWTYQNYKFQK